MFVLFVLFVVVCRLGVDKCVGAVFLYAVVAWFCVVLVVSCTCAGRLPLLAGSALVGC